MTENELRTRTHEVIDRALELLVARDMAGFAALWAPAGSIEFPFAIDDFPERVEGREAVTQYLAHYTEIVEVERVVSQNRIDTVDPRTVVLEFEVAGVATQTRHPYSMRYISVITVDDDGITTYRDYWSPLAASRAISADPGALRDGFVGEGS